MPTEDVVFNIRARDNASSVLTHITKKMGIFHSEGLKMGLAFGAVTLGVNTAMNALSSLQGYIDDSIQKFYEFEKSMAEVATMMDSFEKQLLPEMEKGITSLSIGLGQNAVDLSRGLYQALSAGVDTGHAMEFMSAASKLAAAGLASVETTVDALTTVLNAYGMKVQQVTYVSDVMMKTVELGKLRLEDLASSLGYVVPVAAQAGISLEEITAAIASLTKQGIDAHMATRSLRQVIVNLISPSEEAKDTAISLGVAYDDLTLEARGFHGVLEMINDATEGNVALLNQLIPNVRALTAVMGLSGTQSTLFKETLDEIYNSAGTVAEKLRDVTSTQEYQSRVLTQALEAQSRALGKATSGWDIFWKKQEVWFKAGGWMGLTGVPGLAAMGNMQGLQALAGVYKDVAEAVGSLKSEVSEAWMTDFVGQLQRVESTATSMELLYSRLSVRVQTYKQDLADLQRQLDKLTASHGFQESLRYIGLALQATDEELESYNYLLNITQSVSGVTADSIRQLVMSIRQQREEIEQLNQANQELTMATRENQIKMLEIQLAAANRRGRMTRAEEEQLEALRRENLQYRIDMLRNQQEIDQIKNDGLTEDERRLNEIKRMMQEELYLIQDAYEEQVNALQRSIEYKELLISEHEQDMEIALSKSLDAWQTYYDLVYDATEDWAEDMKKLFKEVAGYTIEAAQKKATKKTMQTPSETPQEILGERSALGRYWNLRDLIKGSFQAGTSFIPETGLYLLHRGEAVVPAAENTMSGHVVNIHVEPITIYCNNETRVDVEEMNRMIGESVQAGIIRGIETEYRLR